MEAILTIGDAPIEPVYAQIMNDLAHILDRAFNGGQKPKKTGFVMLVFPFEEHGGRCNYISNADRKDIIIMMKEQIKRFEGQPDITGHG